MTGSDVDEEREMRELFKNVAGIDLEVDAYELRAILDTNFKQGKQQGFFFNKTCKKTCLMVETRLT